MYLNNLDVLCTSYQYTFTMRKKQLAYRLGWAVIERCGIVCNMAGGIQIYGTRALVFFAIMMFCHVISFIAGLVVPVNVKLALAGIVPCSVKVHIHSFRLSLLNTTIDNTGYSVVVSDNWHSRLWIAKFFKGDMFWGQLLFYH